MRRGKWVKKWEVLGSNGRFWTVAIDWDNRYGCSCPLWIYKRQECHHILFIKNNVQEGKNEKGK